MDGCRLADNPDNQYCCSTSDDGWNLLNWWRVDFDQYYVIDEAVITGRSGNIQPYYLHKNEPPCGKTNNVVSEQV